MVRYQDKDRWSFWHFYSPWKTYVRTADLAYVHKLGILQYASLLQLRVLLSHQYTHSLKMSQERHIHDTMIWNDCTRYLIDGSDIRT